MEKRNIGHWAFGKLAALILMTLAALTACGTMGGKDGGAEPDAARIAGEAGSVTDKGGGVFWIAAPVDRKGRWKKITGFEITYTLVSGGGIGGGALSVNALMFAPGAHTAGDFTMDYSGSIPQYAGSAEELITHCTGAGSFVGPMFFGKGVDAGALEPGGSAVVRFEGGQPLFSGDDTYISVCGLFDTAYEITGVVWLLGEISTNSAVSSWKPVETVQYNDVPTVQNPSRYNYVDITVPKGGGPYPVILWIHGGGWSQLDRTSFFISGTKEYLLYKGFAVVSAEYTLCENEGANIKSGYPQMIYDLKAAARFIRANAGKYNLDAGFIAAMGESAGAHLAMLMGTTNGSAAHEDRSMGNADFSSDVQAMVSYFGPTDAVGKSGVIADLATDPFGAMGYAIFGSGYTDPLAKQASPYWQITGNAPPLFLTHGKNDQAVSIEHSYKMERKARELIGGDNVTAVYYDDAPHASKAAFDTQSAMDSVVEFLLKHKPASTADGVNSKQ